MENGIHFLRNAQSIRFWIYKQVKINGIFDSKIQIFIEGKKSGKKVRKVVVVGNTIPQADLPIRRRS